MDITTINNIWRPVYGKLVKGLALLTPEWSQLQQLKNFEQLSPRAINWPVLLSYGGGIAMSSDGGSTARATSNEPVEATDSWKYMVGRFEVGYDALTGENAGRFASQQIDKQLRFQARDKLNSFKRAIAVQYYGHSDGILFLAEGTASNPSGTQTKVRLKDLYTETGLAATRIRDYITVNKDLVAVHSGTTSTQRGSGVVVAIDETNKDITLASASAFHASVVAGDAIVLYNQVKQDGTDDINEAINGLLDIMRATTLHNISSSSQPDWVAGVDEASYGKVLDGKDLYKWFEEIEQRSGMAPEWVRTTTGVIAAAGGPETSQRRYGDRQSTMVLGFDEVISQGVSLKGFPYVPSGFAFIGSNGALKKLSPDEGDPKNLVTQGDRAGSFKQYENQIGFYKDQIMRAQLTAVSRLGLGIADGITEA